MKEKHGTETTEQYSPRLKKLMESEPKNTCHVAVILMTAAAIAMLLAWVFSDEIISLASGRVP